MEQRCGLWLSSLWQLVLDRLHGARVPHRGTGLGQDRRVRIRRGLDMFHCINKQG